MSRTTLLALLLLSPATGGAGQVEVSAWVGPSLPFYSQSFRYQPPPVPPLPGFGVEQLGEFRFDASGGCRSAPPSPGTSRAGWASSCAWTPAPST